MSGQQDEAEAPAPVTLTDEEVEQARSVDLESRALDYLADRGFPDVDTLGVDVDVVDDPNSDFFGYLVFQSGKQVVGRNLIDDKRPRYLNNDGDKSLFFVGEDDGRAAWLVEGVFDALALYQLGMRPVAALLGSGISDRQAWLLRRRPVYLLLDGDQPGWAGARKVSEKLREYEANPILLELPAEFGKDPGEAYEKHRGAFAAWLSATLAETGASDEGYVTRLFSGQEQALTILPTGVPTWDDHLGGGFKDGVHVLGAEPGVGKTSFVLRRAVEWSKLGKRVLYVTYEISKRQAWARVASVNSAKPWSELERDPSLASKKTQQATRELARFIRIAAGWNLAKLQRAAEHYDAVIVDYLQRMPGPYGGDDSKPNVDHNVSGLSDLARDQGKVVILVSSLPRSGYGQEFTMKSLKESGNIEYVAQSVTGLLTNGSGLVVGKIVKNTRGTSGAFWLQTNLGNLTFTEVKPSGVREP